MKSLTINILKFHTTRKRMLGKWHYVRQIQ